MHFEWSYFCVINSTFYRSSKFQYTYFTVLLHKKSLLYKFTIDRSHDIINMSVIILIRWKYAGALCVMRTRVFHKKICCKLFRCRFLYKINNRITSALYASISIHINWIGLAWNVIRCFRRAFLYMEKKTSINVLDLAHSLKSFGSDL